MKIYVFTFHSCSINTYTTKCTQITDIEIQINVSMNRISKLCKGVTVIHKQLISTLDLVNKLQFKSQIYKIFE